MNTILISGTAKTIPVKLSALGTGFKVQYNVIVWASIEGEQLQYLTSFDELLCGYGDLWQKAQGKAAKYFDNAKFQDGAYTQLLDHLIVI